MVKVKIKNIKTGAVKEVKKSLASDFIGTKKFEIVTEDKKNKFPVGEETNKKSFSIKDEKK